MRVAIFAAGLGGCLAQVALAADMPLAPPPLPVVIPVYSWTGCYIGVNGGGIWSDSQPDNIWLIRFTPRDRTCSPM